MKKHILITLLIFLSFQTINSQERGNKEIISSGKWYIEYMEFGDDKREVPKKMENENWMLFSQNGKVEIVTQGVKSQEEWSYNEKKGILNITEDGILAEFKVQKLNESELVISKVYLSKTTTLGMKK